MPKKINGLALFLAIIKTAKPNIRQKWLQELQVKAPIFYQLAEKLLFTYEDLLRLDDASLAKALSFITEKEWAVAWKLTHESLKKRLLNNMSERRQKDFLALTTTQPRMLKSQVLRIQMHISQQIKKLAEQGQINIQVRKAVRS